LGRRLAHRIYPVFATAPKKQREVIVSTSGVNRAIDSANFFVQSLEANVDGLAPFVMNSPALTAYPADKPVAQAPGVNRFDLYFHKLNAKTDLPSTSDPYYSTYQESLKYQDFLANDPTMNDKVTKVVYSHASNAAAKDVLETIFSRSFLKKMETGVSKYDNSGSFTFTSDDGKYTTTITGDGETLIANAVDAANSLYAVYSITPAMVDEVHVNLRKYFPGDTLRTFGYLSDVQDFYEKGPSITEEAPITYAMSESLLKDFFQEGSAIAQGNFAHAAKLRFTHAEIMIPFQEELGLPSASKSVPERRTYKWENNPWRGAINASLAQNVQWDFYSDGASLLVKMYYNEGETDFPAKCESARYQQGSHYYTFEGLKACYGF
jgi:hypothetical protein